MADFDFSAEARWVAERNRKLRAAGYYDPHQEPGSSAFDLKPLPRHIDAGNDAAVAAFLASREAARRTGPAPRQNNWPWWFEVMLRMRQGDTVNGVPVASPFDNYVNAQGQVVNPRRWEGVDLWGNPLAPPWQQKTPEGNPIAMPWEGTDERGNHIWINWFNCGPDVPIGQRQAPPFWLPGCPKPPFIP